MSRLMELARARAGERDAAEEQCELCGEPIPPDHRHLVNLESRELMCACRACSILFDRRAAGGGHFRLVPDRRLRLTAFEMDDVLWAGLQVPVEMAFFFRNTHADPPRAMAFYPSPAGATESLLELDAWDELERANPVLAQMEPDVEALLVDRARGAREHYLVPIDDCYRLVAVIRTHWHGFTGGSEVWEQIGDFFHELREKSKEVT